MLSLLVNSSLSSFSSLDISFRIRASSTGLSASSRALEILPVINKLSTALASLADLASAYLVKVSKVTLAALSAMAIAYASPFS